MKIGLIDVDGHNFPNLALMKLSAWHKKQGHEVDWFNGFDYCDKVYMAKVFNFTPDHRYTINAGETITGGTGYDLKNKLPKEAEKCFPDYSLYNIKETAYGFLTRGCRRGCEFCIVAEKEGKKTKKVADLQDFWSGQKEIKLLDPNLTASKDKEDLFNQLIKSKATVDFTQGLDIRLLTEKDAEQINRIKTKMIHFAWDNYEFKTYEKLKEARAWLKQKDRNITVYVLTNFNTTHEQDLERVYKLKEIGYTPYIMIYNKESAPKITKKLGRWVNNRFIFRACEKFEDYRSLALMQYSKNQQIKKVKKEVYGNKIPQRTAKAVIAKQKGRCQFMYDLFGVTKTNTEIHHIFGRKNKHHKHDHANLILLSREVHFAYHHQGVFKYDGVTMYAKDLKQWFINHNKKLYGEKEVQLCK